MRLCHSRMPFVRAYPRETQEMVFDAHDRAFAFYKGACTRGIYDNMKTAVDAIFLGKERAYNRRFQQMCSHYLVDPPGVRAGRRARSRTRSARSASGCSRPECGSGAWRNSTTGSPRGSRGAAVRLHPPRSVAMEIGPHHQRHRAAERGIPPAHRDPDRAALRRDRAHAALGPARLRPDRHAQGRRMGDPLPAHRALRP